MISGRIVAGLGEAGPGSATPGYKTIGFLQPLYADSLWWSLTKGVAPILSGVNSFTTVYEISAGVNGIRNDLLLRIGIGVVILVGGVMSWIASRRKGEGFLKRVVASGLVVVWSLVWLGAHVPIYLMERQAIATLLEAYQTGKFRTTEGPVVVKHEQPPTGHTKGDIVSIGGKEFEVNYFQVSPSYNLTISHGGALRAGVYARISYYDDKILRVEIRQPPN